MWYKNSNTRYVNLENGHQFYVRPVDETRGQSSYEIVSTHTTYGSMVLRDQYPNEQAAVTDLEDLLKALKITPLELTDPRAKK